MLVFRVKNGKLHSYRLNSFSRERVYIPPGYNSGALGCYRGFKGDWNYYPIAKERSSLLEPSRGLVEDN